MKQLSNRGAARIGAVWMIVVIVLFFVALAFAYVANQAAEQERETAAGLRTERDTAFAERDDAEKAIVDLSELVGYRSEAIGSHSDIEAVKGGIQTLKDTYALGDTVATFEDTVNPMMEQLRLRDTSIKSLQGQIDTLTKQIELNGEAARKAQGELQDQIATLRQEKGDEAQVLQDQIDALTRQLEDITAQRNALDDELNDAKAEYDALMVQLANERSEHQNRTRNLEEQLKDFQKRAETPDGAIISTSKELGIAWINRGAKDRISEGMIFDIVTGHPNPTDSSAKAKCEVLRVQDTTSEVRIFDQVDPYDPVVADDLIFNPIYDPDGERYAVLAGRFSGTFNEAEIALLLKEIGITVQKELDLTTNYLIVGQPLYTDENGEVLEEPRQPSDLPVYKEALAQGCSIIPISQFRLYFKR